MSQYNEDQIWTPERLDHIRMRPTAYIPSRGTEGQVHQAIELIVNAIDELALMPDGVGKLIVMLCVDTVRETFQLVVKDNGRGLPIGKLLDAYTKLNTSGKFDTTAYETSGGLYGLGAKLSAGVSKYFIPITTRPEGKAAIRVFEGKCDERLELIEKPQKETGVMVVYEPDPSIFVGIDQFSTLGQQQLLTLLQKYCFFRKLNIEFRVHALGLPLDIWNKKIPEIEAIIDRYLHESYSVFSESTFDRQKWLREYWNVQRPFAFQGFIQDSFKSSILNRDKQEQETTIRYQVQLYYVKFDQQGGRFGMLNNLPIDDARSTHTLTIVEELKRYIGQKYITDSKIRNFFIESYKLPLYIAVDVKCPGAEPSGTTKDAFYSSSFRKVYSASLWQKIIELNQQSNFAESLYKELATSIEDAYNKNVTGISKIKNTNRMFENLKYPEKFKDCESIDRLDTELFLVEGESAGGGTEGRNKLLQGQYLLKGKTFNGVDREDNLMRSIESILKDDIYKDIFKIMNVNPSNFDPSSMYFKHLLIMTDADFHGYHISATVVGNIFAVCPPMIESGMVSIVTPPLYGLDYKNKKRGTPRVYLRDDREKMLWMTHKVYMEALDIGIKSTNIFNDKIKYLKNIEYVDFIKLILEIGEAITNIANELVLDPIIVEVLTHVTQYLTPETMNVQKIKEITQIDRVTYDPRGYILVLTHGRTDYVIPLENVASRIYDTVMPMLNKIRWKDIQLYITSKHVNQYKDTPISITKLCEILLSFDELFDISRYKGLASMPPLDKNRTCMDPKYRTVHRITTVGDVTTIFNLLGNDSSYRKQLLKRPY